MGNTGPSTELCPSRSLSTLDAPAAPHQKGAPTPFGSPKTDHPSHCSSKILNSISHYQGFPPGFLHLLSPLPSPCPPHHVHPSPLSGNQSYHSFSNTLHPFTSCRRSLPPPHMLMKSPHLPQCGRYSVWAGSLSLCVLARMKTRTLNHKHIHAYVIANGDTFCESGKAWSSVRET